MVVKRQCSFCANEIEPGTGMMFVKRDGTIYHFCSSSCRKQQLHLGRVGHRRKWTRAHMMKRAASQAATAPTAPTGPAPVPGPSAESEPVVVSPSAVEPEEATPEPAPVAAESRSAAPDAPPAAPGSEATEAPAHPAAKPRRRTTASKKAGEKSATGSAGEPSSPS